MTKPEIWLMYYGLLQIPHNSLILHRGVHRNLLRLRRTGIPVKSEKEFLKENLICDFLPKFNQFCVDNAQACGNISSPPVEHSALFPEELAAAKPKANVCREYACGTKIWDLS